MVTSSVVAMDPERAINKRPLVKDCFRTVHRQAIHYRYVAPATYVACCNANMC